jgi:hypothetical protein
LVEIPLVEEPFRMPDTKWSAWLRRYAGPVRFVSFIVGSVAAGYLWAVVFGDGVPGLQDSAQLDQSSSYPNADVGFIAADALLLIAFLLAAKSVDNWQSPGPMVRRWIGATIVGGAALFALSRLFI